MAILLTAQTRVLAVNATGAYGGAQVRFMREFGTQVVAHVASGRPEPVQGLPTFPTIAAAVAATGATAAAIFTPAPGVRDSVEEAAEAGLGLAFAAAEFVPLHDALRAAERARAVGLWLVGPNSSGIATPGQAVLGALPPGFTSPGRVGVIGRSGTLTMNVCRSLSLAGIGQSSVVHVGGDVICGRNPHEWLRLFMEDRGTDAVVYLGEPGGSKEYALAQEVSRAVKPVVVLVVGRQVPQRKRMGHAGALVGAEHETAAAKCDALAAAGAHVARHIPDIVTLLQTLAGKPTGAVQESAA
jgi:succinyl-CoA synthetase alpha subunit